MVSFYSGDLWLEARKLQMLSDQKRSLLEERSKAPAERRKKIEFELGRVSRQIDEVCVKLQVQSLHT